MKKPILTINGIICDNYEVNKNSGYLNIDISKSSNNPYFLLKFGKIENHQDRRCGYSLKFENGLTIYGEGYLNPIVFRIIILHIGESYE
jgi:hypothetical protein